MHAPAAGCSLFHTYRRLTVSPPFAWGNSGLNTATTGRRPTRGGMTCLIGRGRGSGRKGRKQGMGVLSTGVKDPRGTTAWQRLRLECFARDKAKRAVCVHCGQPIDYSVKPSSTDDSYEPDHRIDVVSHPEYALLPENVQPSHRRCNRVRGSKAGINNLGRRTRNWSGGRGS